MGRRNIGVNAFGGTSEQQNGNRYLSTVGNHISGESSSVNDQFMRVNAFLGQADLSMILHMLSQRSDTDLLSAPKVVTKSGENAVIKVVTEYIYPQDYDVQLQSSSSGSSGSSGGSQSAILAVVEPQNFTMREVGVILDVTPTYSEANGGTIDLELKPQVVDEPTWHNYGMKIPFSGNSSIQSFAGLAEIPLAAVAAVKELGGSISDEQIQTYSDAIMGSSMTAMASSSGQGNMTWYDAPMEQPFFHVRSIDSKVSITPGATVRQDTVPRRPALHRPPLPQPCGADDQAQPAHLRHRASDHAVRPRTPHERGAGGRGRGEGRARGRIAKHNESLPHGRDCLRQIPPFTLS